MSAATPQTPSEFTVCPSCGAAMPSDAESCWLCKWDASAAIITAELVSEPPKFLTNKPMNSGLIAGIITLGIGTIGVFTIAPGIGVVMGVLFVIATVAVAKSLQSDIPAAAARDVIDEAYASPTRKPMTQRPTAATGRPGIIQIIAAVFIALGIIALIALASIVVFVIALIAICANMLGGTN